MTFILPPSARAAEAGTNGNGVPENELQAEMRHIVEGLYGPPVHRLPGLDIGRAYRGAFDQSRYGGDMVDVFQYGDGCTSLAVVDISGHGIRAATHAALAKHALRAYASHGLDARDSVRALNRLCIESSAFEDDVEFFATVFFAIIHSDRSTMQYVSAGHEAACVIGPGQTQMLAATGPLVGLMDDDAAFDHSVVRLHAGSILAAVTDGFSEARNANLEFLGAEELLDVILRNRSRQAELQAAALTRRAFEYANEHLHDDVAALVVKVAS